MAVLEDFAAQSKKDVKTILNYYLGPDKDGDDTFFDGTVIESRRKYSEVPVLVTDLRGLNDDFNLDKQGFQVLAHSSIEKEFSSDGQVKDFYYPECALLLKSITGATRVHVMSHIIRRQSWEQALEAEKDLDNMEPIKQPSTARFVHVDLSYSGARSILDLHLPNESAKLSKTRWAIVNIWRPIKTVNREALCLADARSISDAELCERPLKMAPGKDNAESQTADSNLPDIAMWSVRPPETPEQHKWYYTSHMTPNEVLFFKIFDSKNDGTAKRTPHSAFTTQDDFGPPRQSLELRSLVFWEDQLCHLLERMLERQSNATPFYRPFENAWVEQLVEWLRSDSYADGMPQSSRSIFEKELQGEINVWERKLSEAQSNGKIMMLHTHFFFPASPDPILEYVKAPASYTSTGDNFTLVPTSLLLHPGTVPVITIRNPRLVVPSAYRAMKSVIGGGGRANLLIITSHVWGRLLYDFYMANGIQPLIIDADDYMTGKEFVRGFCARTGLDPNQAVFSWSTTTEEQKEQFTNSFNAVQTTLMGSTGANPARAAKNINLAKEEAEWKEEFGENLPLIKELVQLAMPHFDYLYEKRLIL